MGLSFHLLTSYRWSGQAALFPLLTFPKLVLRKWIKEDPTSYLIYKLTVNWIRRLLPVNHTRTDEESVVERAQQHVMKLNPPTVKEWTLLNVQNFLKRKDLTDQDRRMYTKIFKILNGQRGRRTHLNNARVNANPNNVSILSLSNNLSSLKVRSTTIRLLPAMFILSLIFLLIESR
jgi:hypothetical protein